MRVWAVAGAMRAATPDEERRRALGELDRQWADGRLCRRGCDGEIRLHARVARVRSARARVHLAALGAVTTVVVTVAPHAHAAVVTVDRAASGHPQPVIARKAPARRRRETACRDAGGVAVAPGARVRVRRSARVGNCPSDGLARRHGVRHAIGERLERGEHPLDGEELRRAVGRENLVPRIM